MSNLIVSNLITIMNLKSDKRAVTALEYGLIAAVLGGVIVTAFTSLGGGVTNAIATMTNHLNPA